MASDFKLFKKKDDKKNNGQNFTLTFWRCFFGFR